MQYDRDRLERLDKARELLEDDLIATLPTDRIKDLNRLLNNIDNNIKTSLRIKENKALKELSNI